MHDIKYIRDNFSDFKKKISNRNNSTRIDDILNLDKKNRLLIQEKEALEKQKKDISKSKDEKMFQKSKQKRFIFYFFNFLVSEQFVLSYCFAIKQYTFS